MIPDSAPIWRLNLSTRAESVLARRGCTTVADVCRLTRETVYSTVGAGRRTVAEIEAALARYGRTFREPVRFDVVAVLAEPVALEGGLLFPVVRVLRGGR